MTLLLLMTPHRPADDAADAPTTDVTLTTVSSGRTLVTTAKGATDA